MNILQIGAMLEKCRRDQRKSIEDVAFDLLVSPATVRGIETGKSVKYESVERLCDYYGYDITIVKR